MKQTEEQWEEAAEEPDQEEQVEKKGKKQKKEQKAEQRAEDVHLSEVRQALQAGKALIGAEMVLKQLRSGNLQKVFLAKNCPARLRADIEQYAQLGNVPVVTLLLNNEELGIICKKNFFVAVLGVLRK
ncbi:ribosomal L7Ae/L30e/S12e/Gadd45 family protein [Candidatus Woesearchaeota archaeon]|nr:ribosomal L7Ae/L30e/S12e/Gadd45 family protein [Candidatus Woesearchaeota archaeon]